MINVNMDGVANEPTYGTYTHLIYQLYGNKLVFWLDSAGKQMVYDNDSYLIRSQFIITWTLYKYLFMFFFLRWLYLFNVNMLQFY